MKLEKRSALITGASQGFGKAIAKAFVMEGASVMLCARHQKDLLQVKEELSSNLRQGQKIAIQAADVSDIAQVDKMIQETLDEFPSLDILVNNAGVYGPKGDLEKTNWQEWVDAIHINLLGTVYPCRSVLPSLKERRYGKIINLSGGGATAPLPRLSAYATSKAAVVRFTETLAEETKEFRIDVNAIAPGALNTRLLDEVLNAGPERVGTEFFEKAKKQKAGGGSSLENAASLCVFLASSASDGITGKLISAVWDPWKDLPRYREELKNSDIYTLRRIIPKDRGKTWEPNPQ